MYEDIREYELQALTENSGYFTFECIGIPEGGNEFKKHPNGERAIFSLKQDVPQRLVQEFIKEIAPYLMRHKIRGICVVEEEDSHRVIMVNEN